jgi:hypothetical protein
MTQLFDPTDTSGVELRISLLGLALLLSQLVFELLLVCRCCLVDLLELLLKLDHPQLSGRSIPQHWQGPPVTSSKQ